MSTRGPLSGGSASARLKSPWAALDVALGLGLPRRVGERRRPSGVARGGGLGEVVSHAAEGCAGLREQRGGALVGLLAPVGRDHPVHRRRHEGVLEPERPAGLDQAELEHGVGSVLDRRGRGIDELGDVVDRGRVAEHHGRLERVPGGGAEGLEPMCERADDLGEGIAVEAREQLVDAGWVAAVDVAQQRGQQEGVAARGVVVLGRDPGVGADAQGHGEELLDVDEGERLEGQATRRRLVQQAVERGERQPGVARHHAHDEADRVDLDAAHEVVQEGDRRGVAPVDVVDGDQHRSPRLDVEQGRLERAEQLDQLTVGGGGGLGLAHHRAGAIADRRLGLDLRHELLEDPEGRRGLLAGASGAQHAHVGAAHVVAHGVDRARSSPGPANPRAPPWPAARPRAR